ncbi:MAG: peptidyl-prolyl cis-trans isomerase [Treponema sp.]|jgi:DNA-directed RNA polymerase specialized sigma subunit|nr:peptidyl-prolyl cis-trans isomerase [Treponema sp.]
MDMRMFAKSFLLLALLAGFGTGFLFGGGKAESKTGTLPEGTPIQGETPGSVAVVDLSTPKVADLSLVRSEPIYVQQLRTEAQKMVRDSLVQELRRRPTDAEINTILENLTFPDRRQMLDMMINEKLVLQAAERDKVTISDNEIDQQLRATMAQVAGRMPTNTELTQAIKTETGLELPAYRDQIRSKALAQKYTEQYIVQQAAASVSDREINNEIQNFKTELAAQAGRAPTDKEFDDFLATQGMDLSSLRRQITVQKYLVSMGGGDPSQEAVLAYYNEYIERQGPFVRPATISFDYIQIPFPNTAAKAAAKTRAEDLAKKIGSNTSVFNAEFANATASNSSGSLRYIPLSIEDPRVEQGFGKEFVDKATPLAEGKVSGVIEGPQTFFIIKVTSKFPQENLKLDDIFRLGSAATLREMISSQLMQRSVVSGSEKATQALVKNLRDEASVKVYENLLVW